MPYSEWISPVSWPTITFKPHQEIIWKNTWHRTALSLRLWWKFNSTINSSLNVQVCFQVPVNLVPDSLLAMGVVLVNLRVFFKSQKQTRPKRNKKWHQSNMRVENKSELLSHQQRPEISGKLFLTGCPCLSDITLTTQQLEVNNWDSWPHNNLDLIIHNMTARLNPFKMSNLF